MGGCQSGRKVVTHNSKSDLPLGQCVQVIKNPKSNRCSTGSQNSNAPVIPNLTCFGWLVLQGVHYLFAIL